MAGVKIILNRVNLFTMLRSPGGTVARDARKRAERVRDRAQLLAPVNTGRLRASINVRLRPGVLGIKYEVGSSLHYAKFQHDGTGVYGPRHRPIKAKRGKVMVFTWHGKQVFAREVRGAPATKFLAHALLAAV